MARSAAGRCELLPRSITPTCGEFHDNPEAKSLERQCKPRFAACLQGRGSPRESASIQPAIGPTEMSHPLTAELPSDEVTLASMAGDSNLSLEQRRKAFE